MTSQPHAALIASVDRLARELRRGGESVAIERQIRSLISGYVATAAENVTTHRWANADVLADADRLLEDLRERAGHLHPDEYRAHDFAVRQIEKRLPMQR